MVAERGAAWRIIASMEHKKETIEDKDQLSKTDARVECIDHVLRVTDNAVEGVKCSAQERVQSYTVEQSVDVPVTRRCAFSMKDSDELIPEWLSFVKGVVDSEDPPLNIYRETLPENKILRVIKKHVTKCLEMLAEIAELSDAYKEFYEQLIKCMKFGTDEDSTVGVKTAEVLRFNTTEPGDEQNSFEDYVDRMKEGQNDISYITGENIAVVSSSPFEDNLRKKSVEEHHVTDPMEEYAVYQFKESDGTKLNPTTKEGLNLGDQDNKKKHEELKTEPEPLMKLMKHILVDKVEKAMVSDRNADSPCVLATSEYEYGCSAKIERITETQALRDSSMTSHMVSKKTMEVNPTRITGRSLELKSRQDLHGHLQQQHKSNQHQPTKNNQHQFLKQSAQQERGGESKKERDQEGRKEEERKVEERGSERVKKDAMDWTVVARKKKRKTVQIFVKVDASKVSPMEVSPADDKVEDVMKRMRIQKDEDVYVTMNGKVLRRDEKLKSCEVTDGCTIQVTSRVRGGGRHKDKKSQKERKQAASTRTPEQKSAEEVKNDKGPAIQECDKEAAIRLMEEDEVIRKVIEEMSKGNDVEREQVLENYLTVGHEVLGWDQGQADMMECGIRWAVEARRKGRSKEQGQRGQGEQGQSSEQEQGQQGKQVRFGQEEQQGEMRAESTDEPEVTSTPVEVRTGRGSTGLVRGGDGRHLAWRTSPTEKAKGRAMEEKASMEAKEEYRSRRNTVGTRRGRS